MAIKKDKVVRRETLASKIAGSRSRRRAYRRDLRGRFTVAESPAGTKRSLSPAGKAATRKTATSTLVSKAAGLPSRNSRRLRR